MTIFQGRQAEPGPARACDVCGLAYTDNPPSCGGCGRRKPPCGCARGWSQEARVASAPVHYCPRCSPTPTNVA